MNGGESSASGPGRPVSGKESSIPSKLVCTSWRREQNPTHAGNRTSALRGVRIVVTVSFTAYWLLLAPSSVTFKNTGIVRISVNVELRSRRKTTILTYAEWVSVALVIQHAVRVRLIILWTVACLAVPYFYTYLIKRTIVWERLLNIKCVFWSLKVLSEIFRIVRRVKRCTLIDVQTSSCKVPALLVRFQWNFGVTSKYFRKIEYQIYWKYVRWEPKYSMRMDRYTQYDEAVSRFLQLGERAWKLHVLSTAHLCVCKTLTAVRTESVDVIRLSEPLQGVMHMYFVIMVDGVIRVELAAPEQSKQVLTVSTRIVKASTNR